MAKTVLVTGAGGYIGRHVVTALLERGLDVKALDLRLDGVDERAERLTLDLFSCLLYTSPSPRDATLSRMPSSA